jgi:hypothetical protein
MEITNKIRQLSQNVEKQLPHILTEEATKNAFIMPFIASLGYDIFNPVEVIPEFTADVGVKKGEKVDYAIKKDNKVIILIECKHHKDSLSIEKTSQLYRYFSVTDSRFAIITNGLTYRFYSDLEHPNKMDSKPFFEFNITKFTDAQLAELQKFTKASFNLDSILNTANDLKYVGAITKVLEEEFATPSEEFIKFLASQVYNGRFTKTIAEQFEDIVKKATSQFVIDKVNNKLKSALESNQPAEPSEELEADNNDGIITTEEEIEGFHIIKAIGREVVDAERIVMRDTKSYCGVLLDDNNRKPICRMHFNRSRKYLGLFDADKNETKHHITTLDDIYNFSNEIKNTLKLYVAEEA